MGWGDVISIGLGLGNAALNAANAKTLQEMKFQQVGAALYQEFISAMRNGIFNLKQTAEGVLAGEEESPLKAAGAMRLLDYQLSASGVTPDLFPELSDKEYAATTAKLISSNSNRMYTALDKVEQSKVDQLVEHVRRLADLQYYLEHADSLSRLQAEETETNVGGTVQNWGCLIAIGLFILGGFLAVINSELGALSMFVGWIVGVVALVRFVVVKRRAANEAQKTIQELESSIDWPRFHMLEQQFKTPDEAKQLQKQSEQYVETFFGDYTLLQDGWRS